MSTRKTPDSDIRKTEKQAATQVTLIGMVLDALLGLAKCVVGLLFHSQALLVDGVHSFSDVLSDLGVIGLMRTAKKAPDQDHPYGHDRFETIGTLVLGSFLIAIAGALSWDSLKVVILNTGPEQPPGWPVLVVALLSIASKEWIYRYTRSVGLRIQSSLIIANAWHSRTDAFSSIIVLIGAIGAMSGYPWLDAVAAVGVGLIVAYIGWGLAWRSLKELVDTALDSETMNRLREIAKATEGVKGVHQFRTRRMGNGILLDCHLLVDSRISVSEGHEIGVNVRARIQNAYPNIREVTFHVDAEDDSNGEPDHSHLPERSDVEKTLRANWLDLVAPATIDRLILHYLDEQVDVDLYIRHSTRLEQSITANLLRDRSGHPPWLGHIEIWFDRVSPSGRSE